MRGGWINYGLFILEHLKRSGKFVHHATWDLSAASCQLIGNPEHDHCVICKAWNSFQDSLTVDRSLHHAILESLRGRGWRAQWERYSACAATSSATRFWVHCRPAWSVKYEMKCRDDWTGGDVRRTDTCGMMWSSTCDELCTSAVLRDVKFPADQGELSRI